MTSGLVLATAGEDVRLWSMPTLNLHSVRNGSNANVTSCACSPNGEYVAYAHEEEGLNIASLNATSAPVVKIPTQCEQKGVCFNGNSRYLVSAGVDHVVCIWDIKTKTAKRTYKGHVNPVESAIFNYNDNTIASCSDHGDILLTNVQSGVSSDPLNTGDAQAIRSLAYSFFVRSLLGSAGDSGAVVLWDTKEQKLLKQFNDHKAPATNVSFSPLNDMLLCSSGLDKRIIFYDVTGKKTVKTINTEGPVTACEFMHDGCTVAAGTASGRVYLFDLRQGSTPVKVVPAHKTSVRSLSFQKIPKDTKSPRRTSISESVEKTDEPQTTTNDPAPQHPPVQRKRAPSPPPAAEDENVPTLTRESSNVSQLPARDLPSSSSGTMMGKRENSTMALNQVLNQNKPMTPKNLEKISRMMGDDMFSPIAIDPTIKKTVVGRQKSSPKINQDVKPVEEPPSYSRSKSSLSKFNILAKSSDDINKQKHKEHKEDKEDGKKGLLNLKSPFKKKSKSKYSDESETSSIDSFSLDTTKKSPVMGRRGVKDRTSDRSIDSQGRKVGSKNSDDSGRISPPFLARHIDPNQLMSDITNSLAMQAGDPHNESGGRDATLTNLQPTELHMEFVRSMIQEAFEDAQESVHEDMVNLQIEMIRQMEVQKEHIHQMLQSYSVNDELLYEIKNLRAENDRLKAKY